MTYIELFSLLATAAVLTLAIGAFAVGACATQLRASARATERLRDELANVRYLLNERMAAPPNATHWRGMVPSGISFAQSMKWPP